MKALIELAEYSNADDVHLVARDKDENIVAIAIYATGARARLLNDLIGMWDRYSPEPH